MGVKSAHRMDDWLVAGESEEQALENLSVVSNLLESVGHEMQMDQNEVDQRLVF